MTKSELQEVQEWVNYLTILIESYDTFDLKLKREIIRTGTDIAHSVFELIRRIKLVQF